METKDNPFSGATDPSIKPHKASSFWERLHLPWIRKKTTSPFPPSTSIPSENLTLSPTIEPELPPESKSPQNPAKEPEEEISKRQLGIGEQLLTNLEEKGIPIEAAEFEIVGVAALGGTNERGDSNLFEKVRNRAQHPNGYLIGIGAANVFSILEAFPEGQVPKAILLFDIDPKVVAAGQQLISNLKQSPDNLPSEITYRQKHPRVFYSGEMDSLGGLVKYSKVLHQLASEGNLVIGRIDFTDPRLIDELSHLPDIDQLNNVVYLSNISDHLWRRKYKNNRNYTPNFSFLRKLQPQSPHKNFYIDTLTLGLNYNLRISTNPPEFVPTDFNQIGPNLNWQTRPSDELEGIKENPVWENLFGWDLDKIIQTYTELSSEPLQLERKEIVEADLNRVRTDQLKNYPDLKANLEKQDSASIKVKVVLPRSQEEEKALLEDLTIPYDYERDFIPFIAHTLWQNANTPAEVDKYAFPKRNLFERDPETRAILFSLLNPREWMKGICEMWFLESNVPFEELALAKLYRELEQRLKARNPGVDTNRKTFTELADLTQAA